MRTIIDLPEQDADSLDRLARQEHISRTEAVRRAVREYLRRPSAPAPPDVFGLWAKRRVDAMEYEDKLRDEWQPRP